MSDILLIIIVFLVMIGDISDGHSVVNGNGMLITFCLYIDIFKYIYLNIYRPMNIIRLD